jgi:hypothetical protein
VSFVGTLEDLPFPDLLQALATGRKSGRLTLSSRQGYGILLLREGRIVYAASNAARETLGRLLVSRRLLSEVALQEALEAQHRPKEKRRLGEVLLAQGWISQESLSDVLRQQVEGVLSELMHWPGGFFKFEPLDVPAQAAGEPEGLMLEAARLLDEARRGGRRPMSPAGEQLAAMKAVMAGLRAPAVTNEISQQLLGMARGVVGRAVLFAVRSDGFRALAHTGLQAPGGGREPDLRSLVLSWDEPSVLTRVAEHQEPFRGELDYSPGNQALLAGLGGEGPDEAMALPLVVGSHTALVLYGDDLPDRRPIGPLDGLELLALQVGLALEKNLLELKLRALEAKMPPSA